jgi:hypothetical protein
MSLRADYSMQEKSHAGQEDIDSARDLVVLKLQDMYEVVTRDMMSDSMRYNLIYLESNCTFCVFGIEENLLKDY